ncbi:YpdA family putative bacillithiol disulfide reductase [Niabella aquatica]
MQSHYPVIIIGGGPIGMACAIEAQKNNIRYIVIEKGCLVNSLYHYPVNMTFFSTSERLEIGNVPFVSNNPKPTRNEALEYYRRVAQTFDLHIRLFEEVTKVDSGQRAADRAADSRSGFTVQTSKATYTCDNIIIATGFYDIPYLLNIPGEDLAKVTHYYSDPHFYAFQNVVVVGAMNSAVDAALETFRKGAHVTMVVKGDEIGSRVKYWVRPDIENRIKEGSIRAYFNSTLKEIRPDEVDIITPEGLVTVKNDWVIAATGYQPNLHFLEQVGIELSSDDVRCPVLNPETHETNIPGIYLAGVICGGMNTHRLFIENSREHAVLIVKDIVEKLTERRQ